MSGGHAPDALHVPSVLHPKSKPAMFTPAKRSLPAEAGGIWQVDVGAGAEEVVEAETDVVAVPGTHWE